MPLPIFFFFAEVDESRRELNTRSTEIGIDRLVRLQKGKGTGAFHQITLPYLLEDTPPLLRVNSK